MMAWKARTLREWAVVLGIRPVVLLGYGALTVLCMASRITSWWYLRFGSERQRATARVVVGDVRRV